LREEKREEERRESELSEVRELPSCLLQLIKQGSTSRKRALER
jgi:hypothetical protein